VALKSYLGLGAYLSEFEIIPFEGQSHWHPSGQIVGLSVLKKLWVN